jgi:hypothetical protein
VTTFESLEPGVYTVRARFRRPPPSPDQSSDSGTVLVERCLVTTLASDRIVRIALTTDCVNVTCPAPMGSPAFDQCLNGRCVDPRCDPDDPGTAEHCCDRALLGAECDSDPTLCRDALECGSVLSCARAPRCEGGVCVEPEEDGCEGGTYCDLAQGMCVPTPPLEAVDAGLPDAGPPPIDAFSLDAPGDDAFVADPDADLDAAEPPDAFIPADDAFVPEADAWALDAYRLPDAGRDAWAPDACCGPDAGRDAWAPNDAFMPADASGRPGEDCTVLGDEDGDGASDCADAECAGLGICRLGCAPLTMVSRPADPGIPAAAHWYRADVGVLRNAGGVVCAMRDHNGSAHFYTSSTDGPRLGAISSQVALAFSRDVVMSAASDLGARMSGGYSVFVVSQIELGVDDFTTFRTWAPDSMTEFFGLWQTNRGLGVDTQVRVQEARFDLGMAPLAPLVEVAVVEPLSSGDTIATRVRYSQNGVPRSLPAAHGHADGRTAGLRRPAPRRARPRPRWPGTHRGDPRVRPRAEPHGGRRGVQLPGRTILRPASSRASAPRTCGTLVA